MKERVMAGNCEGGDEKKEDSFTERLLKTRTILISESITPKAATNFIRNLLVLEQEDGKKPITVLINSPGGEIYSGLAMYDMLNFITCPVQTLVVGLAASMGSILLLAGEKSRRFALQNAKILIHQPLLSGVYQGSASELEIQANEMIKVREQLNKMISEKTGKPLKEVERDTERDNWMSADEALEYGLIAKIISSKSDM